MLETLLDGLSASSIANSSNLTDYFATQLASLSPLQVIVALIAGLAAGLIIALVYRVTYRGVMYSPTFTTTLLMMTLITTPVVMVIKSNISLSLGMVGALSIVRFRTAVKDPMDTAYLFWALTMGILLGTELWMISLVTVIGISLILLGLSFFKFHNPNVYLLVLHYEEEVEYAIESELKRSVKQRKLRSKTVTRAGAEMTIECRLEQNHDIVSRMLNIEGVHDATLVACQTEAGL
ncbi:MAG: DUF4956 domain-containing protein [Eubacteriales bacterium]|nr:DUF4956 domain-containing protein [Eubacteriales bacterium]MDD3882002.1 DUF4956 domain-containing protein [Eubacteriales bacterium]MDD4513720.1 DUF4956 domain-containing protein [Eubacteriales bacterium]